MGGNQSKIKMRVKRPENKKGGTSTHVRQVSVVCAGFSCAVQHLARSGDETGNGCGSH